MRRANKDQVFSFMHIGEALVHIQALEEALTTSIVFKVDVTYPLKDDFKTIQKMIDKRRALTLGRFIGAARKSSVYNEDILVSLDTFCIDRN